MRVSDANPQCILGACKFYFLILSFIYHKWIVNYINIQIKFRAKVINISKYFIHKILTVSFLQRSRFFPHFPFSFDLCFLWMVDWQVPIWTNLLSSWISTLFDYALWMKGKKTPLTPPGRHCALETKTCLTSFAQKGEKCSSISHISSHDQHLNNRIPESSFKMSPDKHQNNYTSRRNLAA